MRPSTRPALANAVWRRVSVTTAQGATTADRAWVGAQFDARGCRRTITTPARCGTGVQVLGRGTYRLSGERLVMTGDDGRSYGDFTVSWDADLRLLLLVYPNGSVMRLRHHTSLADE